MNDRLEETQLAICAIDPENKLQHDHIALTLTKLEGYIAQAQDLKRQLKDAMKPWIEANGPVVIGDVRWVLVNKKTEKVRDLKSAVMALEKAVGGEFDLFIDCLSVNAIKTGAAKKVLGNDFEKFFEVTIEKDVNHKPIKEVVALNERFLR